MSIYRIADLNVKIENEYSYTGIICRDYIAKDDSYWDITARADKSEYAADRLIVPDATDGYLESLSIYRSISNQLIDYSGFILHSSVTERNGEAYAFAAKSGTGKTTHCKLWLDTFPDARIINGDKPLVRISDEKVFIYGTPWCGKENYNVNTKAPLKAVCFLERAEQNSIDRISKSEAVARIMPQLLIPKNPEYIHKLLDLVERFVELVPAYLLKCNMTKEAAFVSYSGMQNSNSGN